MRIISSSAISAPMTARARDERNGTWYPHHHPRFQIDEEALALKAARVHARKLKGLEWNKFREKMSGHLGRRGFGFDVIIPVTRKVWEETQDQVDNFDIEEKL